jgi:outer membrane receptor for ferrienterochelin and colicin
MTNRRLLRAFFCFFVFYAGCVFASPLLAQTGAISGQITDAKHKEPLIGAAVVIRGTTIGAVTDMEGHFRIEGIRPGAYSVSVSYISYQAKTLSDVRVSAGRETVLPIALEDAGITLKNVTVFAQRRLDSEMAVLSEVRRNLPVASGISAQQIGKTQDSDAAEALRRVPGVTIIEDRFIVVRGLSQRYNNVWLNEATTPSGETDSRAFSFDVLPSSLIDNLMVFKSASAELPADFSGGFVRVYTKNVPEGNLIRAAWQTGYQTNASFRRFHLAEGYASNLNATPALIADPVDFTRRTNTGWTIKNFAALPEQKLSLSLDRSFHVGEARAGLVASLNGSTGYDYFETENNNYLSYDIKNERSSYRFRYDDVQYRNTVKLGALLNGSLITDRHKLELRNFFNRRETASLSQRQGTDYYSDDDIRRWEANYTSRTTYAGQLSGSHRFGEEAGKVDWTAGFAYAGYSEPDRKDVKSMLHTTGGQSRYYVSDPTRYYQKLDDRSLSFSAAYERTFKVSDHFTPVLHAGVYGEYKDRNFTARRFVYNLLGTGYNRYADWDYTSVFADEHIAADKIYMKESTNKSDAYNSNRRLGATYLSVKLNYDRKLHLNAGVRMEYDGLKLNGYESDGIKPVSIDEAVTNYFPSLNMAYHINEKHLLRLAYGRSVNRPEFREIVPYVYYDFTLNANLSGRPDLKNAYIDNLDLRYEFYPSDAETLTAGIFYKHFNNPIEQTYNEAGSGLQYTFHNARRAETLGIEIDVKKQLDFVDLKGLNLVFNGAYIYSRIHFPEGSFERDRPMQGQSPYLVNAGFFYQQEEKGLSVSLLYNRIGKRIESVGVPMQNPNDDIPDIYEMPRNSLDLTFSKTIGRRIEIKGGIKDLFNAKIEYKQFLVLTDPSSGEKREVEQRIRSYHPGMTVNAGIALRF